ncbi:MAG: threonine aldolase [Saprospiraceae bacterium]|nr:threonine aldolase [Saprospiraceae bacterium]
MGVINLISDTVTKPTKQMLSAMMSAEVGDDVFGMDPTINALEAKAAGMFDKEAAMFCPSGTMTNQIAIKTHTQPLDEIICDIDSHVYQYETGGYGFNSGVGIKLIQGSNGKISADQIKASINPDYDWLPHSRLVVIENSCNKGGGSIYTIPEIEPIAKVCRAHDLMLHLDGARLFNVLVETGESTQIVGSLFDSISICLSKGLGAPVGSLLIGDKSFIKQARRYRKVMGGGMRQAGYLAAAGIYALDNHIDRLSIDNDRAKDIGKLLDSVSYVTGMKPVQTNILIFDLDQSIPVQDYLDKLKSKGVLATAFGPHSIRFTFHLDISEDDVQELKNILKDLM